jgi:SAM-dependent methyltransferase
MTIPKKKKTKDPSPAQVEYLAALEEWTTRQPENLSENLQSLLKNNVVADNTSSMQYQESNFFPQLAESKLLQELNSLYEEYSFVTAKDASLTDDLRLEREESQQDSLVYGEIELSGFIKLLRSLPTSTNDIFYDLGSGSGRAVFAARFAQDYQKCIGIELLSNLNDLAQSVMSLYKFQYQSKLRHTQVSFVYSDLLDYDWWTDGTVVYLPNLLFDAELMEQIAVKANFLQEGAYLVCLKQNRLFEEAFELIRQQPVPMSWGDSNVYVYQRKRDEQRKL